MRGTRVEGAVVVAEMAISVNLTGQTIEQVIAKMRSSHESLLGMLVDDAVVAGVPPRATTRLGCLVSSAAAQPASFFNSIANYEAATRAALAAEHDTLAELGNPRLWEDGGADVATRMWSSAALCARSGVHSGAVALLRLLVDKSMAGETMASVREAAAAAAAASGLDGAHPERWRLEAAAALLQREGVSPPWPPTSMMKVPLL